MNERRWKCEVTCPDCARIFEVSKHVVLGANWCEMALLCPFCGEWTMYRLYPPETGIKSLAVDQRDKEVAGCNKIVIEAWMDPACLVWGDDWDKKRKPGISDLRNNVGMMCSSWQHAQCLKVHECEEIYPNLYSKEAFGRCRRITITVDIGKASQKPDANIVENGSAAVVEPPKGMQ